MESAQICADWHCDGACGGATEQTKCFRYFDILAQAAYHGYNGYHQVNLKILSVQGVAVAWPSPRNRDFHPCLPETITFTPAIGQWQPVQAQAVLGTRIFGLLCFRM
jgi:hypothetical protein